MNPKKKRRRRRGPWHHRGERRQVIEGSRTRTQGVGGTGHDNHADAAGMRPQDEYTARPDARQPICRAEALPQFRSPRATPD